MSAQLGDMTELRRLWAAEQESTDRFGLVVAKDTASTEAYCAEMRATARFWLFPWSAYPGFELVTEETERR